MRVKIEYDIDSGEWTYRLSFSPVEQVLAGTNLHDMDENVNSHWMVEKQLKTLQETVGRIGEVQRRGRGTSVARAVLFNRLRFWGGNG